MALVKFEFQPGINKDDTPLAAEGGYVDADKIRFVNGKPQVIGGWEAVTSSTYTGIARGAHAWINLQGQKYKAWGTADKLYCYMGGGIVDITPPHSEGVLTDPFTTQSGSPTVLVTHANHALANGDSVTFANSAAVGGLTLNGTYVIAAIVTPNTYQITASGNASSSATGGGKVDYSAALSAGLVDGMAGSGYGTGTYGTGTYGGSTAQSGLPRVWSLDNWGERLLAVPRGGGLYEFQPQESYPELVTGGDFASSAGWTTGTGWSIGSGVATKVAGTASNLVQATSKLIGGSVVRVSFKVTRTAGTVALKTLSGTPQAITSLGDASEPVSLSGTYSRLFLVPATTTQFLFEADAAFAGTIDDVSIKVESKAYRIDEAPNRSEGMFVTPERTVILFGTVEEDGDYNPLCIRNCDIENNRVWNVELDNIAGELFAPSGSRCVAGLAARRQLLIWTDNALAVMQFTGASSEPYTIDLMGTGCGAIGLHAVGEHSGVAFWWGRNNFYLFNGSAPQIIPCNLKQDVFNNLASAQEEKVFCGINPGFSEVWFFYPDARDGKECSRYVALNWLDSTFVPGTFTRSAWIKPGVYPDPVGFGTNGTLHYHERGRSANGGPIMAYLETAFFDVEDGGNLVHINRIVPDFEDQQGGVAFNIKFRQWPNGAEYTRGPFTANPDTQKLDFRATGRQVKVRFNSSANPTFWRMGALRMDIQPTGMKR